MYIYICIDMYVCMYYVYLYMCVCMYVCVLIESVPAPLFSSPLLLLFLFLGTGGAPGEEAVCLREVMGYNMYT